MLSMPLSANVRTDLPLRQTVTRRRALRAHLERVPRVIGVSYPRRTTINLHTHNLSCCIYFSTLLYPTCRLTSDDHFSFFLTCFCSTDLYLMYGVSGSDNVLLIDLHRRLAVVFVEDSFAELTEVFGLRELLFGVGLHEQREGLSGDVLCPRCCPDTNTMRCGSQLSCGRKFQSFSRLKRKAVHGYRHLCQLSAPGPDVQARG